MRKKLLAGWCAGLLLLCAYLSARTTAEPISVRLRLVDAETGRAMAGIVRVFRTDQETPMPLPGLLDRLRGLEKSAPVSGWHVVGTEGAETTLPRAKVRLEALSGLETAFAVETVDLAKAAPGTITLKLPVLFRPDEQRLAAGNTHLHLRGLAREQSDDYLRQIPAADGLKILFISYLERVKDDRTYITNRYPIGNLDLAGAGGVLLNNGEEHRHNFEAYAQGFGHVMLLDIQRLVKPVSIGPGLTGEGFDDLPLRAGIDDARRQGGTILWCHNTNGFEDVPSALAGRLDALNVFDGSRTGAFEDNYYRYLNIGLRLPISTGTDWFMYDFSRVYARVDKPLSVKSWLEAVKAGRCLATNGPLLTLAVDGRPIGDVVDLPKAKTVHVEARGVGRLDFQRLQLVQNGKVVDTQLAKPEGNAFSARISRDAKLDGPGWFGLRIDAKTKNELGNALFAHSSPVYVTVGGESFFDLESARALLVQLEEGKTEIRRRGRFSSPQAADRLLSLYDEALTDLSRRINQRGK